MSAVRRFESQLTGRAFSAYRAEDHLVVQYVTIEKSSRIVMAGDADRGTWGLSMRPDRKDELARLDYAERPYRWRRRWYKRGGGRANVGRILALHTGPNEDELQKGDYILFDQHSAPDGFSIRHAETLADMFDLPRGQFVFLIPYPNVCAVLPGLPEPGSMQ